MTGKGGCILLDTLHDFRSEFDQLPVFKDIIGRSPSLLRALDMALRVANRQTPILLIGDTGTGKDLLARAIHENSHARDRDFRKISCGLLKHDAREQSLALHSTTGTLYLDDVAELPPHLQLELLQLFQDSETRATAGSALPSLRVIASTSTHGNLTRNGNIRPDLYYRLSVVPVQLPSLRDRREDLPELIQYFMGRIAKRHDVPPMPLATSVYERWTQYGWPGNIRELENAVERLLLVAADVEFEEERTPQPRQDQTVTFIQSLSQGLPESGLSLSQLERDLLVAALTKFGGNQTKAARYLNISRRTLIYRMGKYKLRTAESSVSR
jgi:DNA-binding NtrC family response regulator